MAHTSTVIVALPSEDSAVHGFGAEQKHATLLFLGEVTDPVFAHNAARTIAETHEPFAAEVVRSGPLGSASPPAQVLFLDSTDLKKIRDKMLEHDDKLREQYDAIEQFPEYTPHITIGYPGEGEDADGSSGDDVDAAFEAVPEIVFDRIGVWHQGEQTEYPMTPSKLLGLVAGYRYVRTAEGAKRFGVPIGTRIEVDDQGRPVRLDSASKRSTAPVVAPSFEKVDPNRTPTKFVATVPGQKAKIPGIMSLSNLSGGSAAAAAEASFAKTAPRAAQKPKNANPELRPAQKSALTNLRRLQKYTKLTKAQRSAITKLNKNQKLSDRDKLALRRMIKSIIRKMVVDKNRDSKKNAQSSTSSSKPRSAEQKAATKKAQQASSESTSTKKKKAQAAAQAAATEASAFERKLRAAFKALGGNPDNLAREKNYSSVSDSTTDTMTSGSGTVASNPTPSNYTSSYMYSTAANKQNETADRLTSQSLSSLSSEELRKTIRSLVAISSSNPSSQVKNAITRARAIAQRRSLKRRLEDAKKPNGWA